MEGLITNTQESLENFRIIIAELKRLEEIKGTNILKECNPNELNEEEEIIYEKFISGQLTIEKSKKYEKNSNQSDNKSKKDFSDYINNMLTKKLLEEELRKRGITKKIIS